MRESMNILQAEDSDLYRLVTIGSVEEKTDGTKR